MQIAVASNLCNPGLCEGKSFQGYKKLRRRDHLFSRGRNIIVVLADKGDVDDRNDKNKRKKKTKQRANEQVVSTPVAS